MRDRRSSFPSSHSHMSGMLYSRCTRLLYLVSSALLAMWKKEADYYLDSITADHVAGFICLVWEHFSSFFSFTHWTDLWKQIYMKVFKSVQTCPSHST